MDWKDALGSLLQDPELPKGEDLTSEAAEAANNSKPKLDTLRVVVDRKGRKGKTATIIEGFTVGDEEVAEVAARLKKRLGVGGSSRGGEILVQGDAAERVRALLREMGYKVK